jgi:hypothetical protein
MVRKRICRLSSGVPLFQIPNRLRDVIQFVIDGQTARSGEADRARRVEVLLHGWLASATPFAKTGRVRRDQAREPQP